jgi:glucose/arabinose dehydrogenase
MNRHFPLSIIAVFVAGLCGFVSNSSAQLPPGTKSDLGPGVPAFLVRPGYRVTRALPAKAPGLRNARFLEFSGDGKTLFLAQRQQDEILALRDPDANGVYKTITTFVKDKHLVQGMCWLDGWLYASVAGEGSVFRARDTNGDGVADDVQDVLPKNAVPLSGGHSFEGLLVTKGKIYLTSSDPTNMTKALDSPNKTIYVFDFDPSSFSAGQADAVRKTRKVFCTGVRNNEKLRYRPGTTEIYGFDNGSDNFGKEYGETTLKDQPITDLLPPEELNLYVQGGFYGHPYLSGPRIPRPEFAKRPDIIELAGKTTPPAWDLHAHWAVLGFTFITKEYFPGVPVGDIFCCSHGSWDSVHPVGSCIQRICFDPVTGKPYGSMTIVDCAGGASTKDQRRLARPVDCAEAPDGTIVFTSDEPAGLFRISKSNDK